jgi:hypothetical protein
MTILDADIEARAGGSAEFCFAPQNQPRAGRPVAVEKPLSR